MDEVNERSSSVLTVAFADEDGDPVTPSAATCRIDDEATGTSIRAATAFVPSGSSHDLDVTAAENRCLGTNEMEVRVATIHFTYGSNPVREDNAEYRYAVRNLRFVVNPA